MTPSESLTELLYKWPQGSDVHARVMPLVYSDLRHLAGILFAKERPEHSLQATGLVNEAYIRLEGGGPFHSREHFFGAAAKAMRRTLVDHARRRDASKRGGNLERVELEGLCAAEKEECAEILDMDEALHRLAALDPRQYELVQLRYFAGLTLREAASVLGISHGTAKDVWAKAKTWLKEQFEN